MALPSGKFLRVRKVFARIVTEFIGLRSWQDKGLNHTAENRLLVQGKSHPTHAGCCALLQYYPIKTRKMTELYKNLYKRCSQCFGDHHFALSCQKWLKHMALHSHVPMCFFISQVTKAIKGHRCATSPMIQQGGNMWTIRRRDNTSWPLHIHPAPVTLKSWLEKHIFWKG